MVRVKKNERNTGADLGYEAQLWKMAYALRNNIEAAESKRDVLGLIFLKYISNAFEAKHARLESQVAEGAARAVGTAGLRSRIA